MLNNIFDVEPETLGMAILMHMVHCKGKGEEAEDETVLN